MGHLPYLLRIQGCGYLGFCLRDIGFWGYRDIHRNLFRDIVENN